MHQSMISHLRILIIDADKSMIDVLQSMLFDLGIRHIAAARTSIDAFSKLRSERFDAIFLVDNLAPHSAMVLTKELRAAALSPNQRTPIIFIADNSERSFIERARDIGMSEFIRKPLSGKIIQQRLITAVESPRNFISESVYTGPDRRRKTIKGLPKNRDRRKSQRRKPARIRAG